MCVSAAGQNDTPEVAHKLGKLLSRLNNSCHVNLIPLNPTAGFDGAPTKAAGELHGGAGAPTRPLPPRSHSRTGADLRARQTARSLWMYWRRMAWRPRPGFDGG